MYRSQRDSGCGNPTKLLYDKNATPAMLINEISQFLTLAVKKEAEKIGLSYGNRRLLMFLADQDGVTQLQLVRKARVSAPSVSVALVKMESEGLVKRLIDPDDKRNMKVCITEKGEKMDSKIREKCRDFDDYMAMDISEEDIKQTIKTLRKMLENILDYKIGI